MQSSLYVEELEDEQVLPKVAIHETKPVRLHGNSVAFLLFSVSM